MCVCVTLNDNIDQVMKLKGLAVVVFSDYTKQLTKIQTLQLLENHNNARLCIDCATCFATIILILLKKGCRNMFLLCNNIAKNICKPF